MTDDMAVCRKRVMQVVLEQAPERVIKEMRVTAELRSMEPDSGKCVVVDHHTAHAMRSFARYHGWKIVTKKEGEATKIWRVA